MGEAAHTLKSSLDGLGVASLRGVIRAIEAFGAAPPAPDQTSQQIAQVRDVTEQVMASLREEFPEKT